MPSVVSVHRLNKLIALPSQQNGLSQLANLFCPVPVSGPASGPVKPSITVVSFALLSPVSKVSPLQLDQFQAELRHHPDKSAVVYVISGIQDGFWIGFNPSVTHQ